ncbi:hypothetical protein [Bacillus sp. Marseille-P3661]|uniref:hypothetical protein n=1 Tax=Bacillus sp. Marseille-P3661 TaxID=1936234 RepID=UPI000C82A189|nr:hypothetical protein [Bacillus sp. Marseille-P3661]
MNYNQEIRYYGKDIQDYDISPFEMIDAFHRRTKFHKHFFELTSDEQNLLIEYDKLLLKNANKVYELLKNIYDFQTDKPTEEWWWHLDKVAKGQLSVDIDNGTVNHKTFLSTIVEFESKEAYDLFLDWSRDKQIIVHKKHSSKDQKII